MKHLVACWNGFAAEAYWCHVEPEPGANHVDDPLKADCAECLREAATYGAKAAMRCAAVEAGASSDPEIAAERDAMIVELDKIRAALGHANRFVCSACYGLFHVDKVGFNVGLQAWCPDCTASRGRIL